MKIIHDPEACPLCEYPREGLEPGRSCPECGLGLFPGAPVFDFAEPSWLLRILTAVQVLFVVTTVGYMIDQGVSETPLIIAFFSVCGIVSSWSLRISEVLVFASGEFVCISRRRVVWRVAYDDLCEYRRSRIWPWIVLRSSDGKKRLVQADSRKVQATLLAAIADVHARYRTDREVPKPT